VKTIYAHFVALLLIAATAHGQATHLSESCDLSVIGATETKSFLAFDRELREAIAKQDTTALSFLVQFPLRINSEWGAYSLDDPDALRSHFQEVFPVQIRNAILRQKLDSIFCRDEGVMYGNGDIWVNPSKLGYAIEVVNLEVAENRKNNPSERKIDFICQTDSSRIVIDADAKQVPRYRAWNKPHSVTGDPDLKIDNGKSEVEGTGGCSHKVWTFKAGSTTYTTEELGCFPDSNEPPKRAVGMFTVQAEDKHEVFGWCY
jgi:hypothetical protein